MQPPLRAHSNFQKILKSADYIKGKRKTENILINKEKQNTTLTPAGQQFTLLKKQQQMQTNKTQPTNQPASRCTFNHIYKNVK